MVSHVTYICRIDYYHLLNIASIRLMYSLVISRIDYANYMLIVQGEVGTPLPYFMKCVGDDIIRVIADQSKLYSVQKTGYSINTNSHEIYFSIYVHCNNRYFEIHPLIIIIIIIIDFYGAYILRNLSSEAQQNRISRRNRKQGRAKVSIRTRDNRAFMVGMQFGIDMS